MSQDQPLEKMQIKGENFEHLYLAIDIEGAGDHWDYPIVSIGFTLGTKDTPGNRDARVLQKKRFTFTVPDQSEFDPNCWSKYWNTPSNLTLLEEFKKEGQEPAMVMTHVESWLNGLEDEYPDTVIEFVTDNGPYDIARTDYYLFKYRHRKPMRFRDSPDKRGEKYRVISDPCERITALDAWEKVYAMMPPGVIPDHRPENDAEYHYWCMVLCDRIMEDRRREKLERSVKQNGSGFDQESYNKAMAIQKAALEKNDAAEKM